MKKIAIALIGLCLSNVALADDYIRIINDDKQATMSVTVQKCNDLKGTVSCPLTMNIPLGNEYTQDPSNKHFVDLLLPPAYEHAWYHVAKVTATKGSQIVRTEYPSEKRCSGITGGDTITLDSHATDVVACNDHNFGPIIK